MWGRTDFSFILNRRLDAIVGGFASPLISTGARMSESWPM